MNYAQKSKDSLESKRELQLSERKKKKKKNLKKNCSTPETTEQH